MRVAVAGGNLQGIETAYLARKAGWEVLLIDRRKQVPARGLCDSFLQIDAASDELPAALRGVDILIPALEDDKALAGLERAARARELPFAFHPAAYRVSSSKVESNCLFRRLGIPLPRLWPEAGFPLIAKPSRSSGSRGLRILRSRQELERNLPQFAPSQDWVLQELLQGRLYSLEILGSPGRHFPLQVTDLELDAGYECKRVLVPSHLAPEQVSEFESSATALASALELKGLMDVEAILHQGELKVLEIDARVPSQTPTAVYWSTGWNMIEMLGRLFLDGPPPRPPRESAARGVVYEHIQVREESLEVGGEHLISRADPLSLRRDFFGANEAITNYAPGRKQWVATLIFCGSTREEAWERRGETIRALREHFELGRCADPEPLP